MKTIIVLALMLTTTLVSANPSPIKKDVVLGNSDFSAMIYKALSKKVKPTQLHAGRRTINRIILPALLTCAQDEATKETSCTLIRGAWKDMGESVYSVITDKNVDTLFNSLSVRAVKEPGTDMKTKSIELEVDDQNGGTERNHLTCTKMGAFETEMGLRSVCMVINAL